MKLKIIGRDDMKRQSKKTIYHGVKDMIKYFLKKCRQNKLCSQQRSKIKNHEQRTEENGTRRE